MKTATGPTQSRAILRSVWGDGITLTPAQYETLVSEYSGTVTPETSALEIALSNCGLWDRWNEAGQPRGRSWFILD